MNYKIKVKVLDIAFIKKDYIEGNIKKGELDYEKYLLEFINNSKFVLDYGHVFSYNEKQSKGECDISNGKIDIDFKLLLPQKTVESLKNHSSRLLIDENGAITLYDSISHDKYILYNYLGLFNSLCINDILKIDNGTISSEEDKIVNKSLKILRADKNVIFFIPIEVVVPQNIDYIEYLNIVMKKFYNYLKCAFDYRKLKTKKDTYVSFVIKNKIVFLKLVDNKLLLYDKVPINKSVLFMKIKNIILVWCDDYLDFE